MVFSARWELSFVLQFRVLVESVGLFVALGFLRVLFGFFGIYGSGSLQLWVLWSSSLLSRSEESDEEGLGQAYGTVLWGFRAWGFRV